MNFFTFILTRIFHKLCVKFSTKYPEFSFLIKLHTQLRTFAEHKSIYLFICVFICTSSIECYQDGARKQSYKRINNTWERLNGCRRDEIFFKFYVITFSKINLFLLSIKTTTPTVAVFFVNKIIIYKNLHSRNPKRKNIIYNGTWKKFVIKKLYWKDCIGF